MICGSNPRPHQNLIYFDLRKLAQRPLLSRQIAPEPWRSPAPIRNLPLRSRSLNQR